MFFDTQLAIAAAARQAEAKKALETEREQH